MPNSLQSSSSAEQSPFKLPRSSYNELVKIIMAYGKVNKPASLDEISQYCGVGSTSVSANNAFLSAIGAVEGGKAKIATQKGLRLARALEHQLADEIVQAWRQLVYQNSFLHKMITAVKIRRGFETSAFESHIAYSSGEPRTAGTMTGARTVIDILRSAMVIKEQDGKLQVVDSVIDENEAAGASPTADKDQSAVIVSSSPEARTTSHGGVKVLLQLRLDVTVDDLEGLGTKLRKMIADFEGTNLELSAEDQISTDAAETVDDRRE